MAYKTVRIRPQGLNKDVVASGIPDHWTELLNMLVRDGSTWRAPKDVAYSTAEVVNRDYGYAVAFNNTGLLNPNNRYGLLLPEEGAATLWLADEELAAVNVTPAGYLEPFRGRATGGQINGYPFISTGKNAVFYWDWTVGGIALAAPGWPAAWTSVGFARRFGDFVMVGDIREGAGVNKPDQVSWSDRAAPGAWPTTFTPVATNEAGDRRLQGLGPVIDGAELGDGFMVYKDDTAHYFREVGLANGVLGARRASTTIGLMAQNCIQTIDNLHYVVTPDDVIAWDGVRGGSIMSPSLRRWFFETELNWEVRELTYTAYNPQFREFWVCYSPAGVSSTLWPTQALVFNGQRWSKRTIGSDLMQDSNGQTSTRGYPQIVATNTARARTVGAGGPDAGVFMLAPAPAATGGGDNGNVMLVGKGAAEDNALTAAEIQGIELSPGERSTIARIRPVGPELVPMTISVQGSEDPSPTAVYAGGETEIWNVDRPEGATFGVNARYHKVGFILDTGDDGPCRLTGFDIDFEPTGGF